MATILVTRPEKDAERLALRLRADGHDAIVSPVLAVAAIDAPAPDSPVDALVVTSANATPWLARADIRAALGGKPVFAVGDRSAEAARGAGYGDVRSASGDAADLTALIAASFAPPKILLAAVGRVHGEEPVASLRARGFEVIATEVYDATPADQLSAEAVAGLRYDVIDAVLHYSPRSAAIFFDLAKKAGAGDHLARPRHVCLSPEVAAALPEELQGSAVIAAEPNEDDLLAALATTLSERTGAEDVGAGAARPRRTPRSRPARTIDGEARRVSETDIPHSDSASTGDDGAAESPLAKAIAAPENFSPASVESLRESTPAATPTHADGNRDAPPAVQSRSDSMTTPDYASRSSAPSSSASPAAFETTRQPPPESATTQKSARSTAAIPIQRKTPIVIPFLAGAIAGALAGAAIMLWSPAFLQRRAPQPAPIDAAALDARLAAFSRREDIAALQQGLATAGANLERERTALRAEIEALSQRIAAITAAPAAPATPVAPAPSSPASPSASIEDAEARRVLGATNEALTAATQRIAALEAKAAALEQALASRPPPAPPVDTSAVVRRHALATALTQALARGAPYASELDALKALGAAPPNIAALESFAANGAPTPRAFATEFAALIPRLLQTDSAQPASAMERATGWLRGLVRVRPVGDVAGVDPAAIVARTEAALARGALADAHTAFQTLPEARRAVAADFGQRLKQRADAAAAAQALTDESTRALAAPAK